MGLGGGEAELTVTAVGRGGSLFLSRIRMHLQSVNDGPAPLEGVSHTLPGVSGLSRPGLNSPVLSHRRADFEKVNTAETKLWRI